MAMFYTLALMALMRLIGTVKQEIWVQRRKLISHVLLMMNSPDN